MSLDRQEIIQEIFDAVRDSQSATDDFDQAVADRLGINRTDLRALDVISRGPVTPSVIAERLRLTGGAVTTVIDRLERRGYARRTRDDGDRRRVLVELTEEAQGGANEFYGGFVTESQALFAGYSDEQLETILHFLRSGIEMSARQLAKLRERD